MLFDNKIEEYDDEIESMEVEQQGKCGCGHGHDLCGERPSCMCMIMGIKIMKSAVELENALASYLECQCRIIKRLIRNEQYDIIDNVLKQMSDNLHQIYNIESQIISKIEKGAIIADCLEPEG